MLTVLTPEEALQTIDAAFSPCLAAETVELSAACGRILFRDIAAPSWTLNIIGARPKPDLLRLASDRVRITGFVEDINAEIRRNRFAVFPLTMGAGVKFKVLLACGLGLPVITGAVGAEGIDPDFLVLLPAETDAEYKSQIETLMNSPDLCRRKSAESLAFVRQRFNWAETEALLSRIYPEEAAD